ncbi:MAG TPA: hypothetical protein VHA33_29225 [Candidatus Angelobacter sp.]|nr:hypothetical protein [Candidatus Angelobacter sp.]
MRQRKQNTATKAMTYEQVEARKARGVEGLERLGEDGRADTLEEESVESFAERKNITIVNPQEGEARSQKPGVKRQRKTKPVQTFARAKSQKPAARSRKGNPDTTEAAVEMFETFHGRRPGSIREIEVRQNDRRNLSGCGTLMYLQMEDGMPLNFSEDRHPPIVACDPDGNQLYFLGNVDLEPCLEQEGIDLSKDMIVVGDVQYIIYTTDKDFHNFEEKDYQHEFGEEGGELPVLMFNKLDRTMWLLGGSYVIKREGIVN